MGAAAGVIGERADYCRSSPSLRNAPTGLDVCGTRRVFYRVSENIGSVQIGIVHLLLAIHESSEGMDPCYRSLEVEGPHRNYSVRAEGGTSARPKGGSC